jgi:hypothetical protein
LGDRWRQSYPAVQPGAGVVPECPPAGVATLKRLLTREILQKTIFGFFRSSFIVHQIPIRIEWDAQFIDKLKKALNAAS